MKQTGNKTAENVATARRLYEQYISNLSSQHCQGTDYYLFGPNGKVIYKGTYMPTPKLSQLLQPIADNDVKVLEKKDAEYGSSWKKRGGVGAFMMLARKWDRLETQATRKELDNKFDIFDAIEQDNAHPPGHQFFESTLETIRDLRRYLLLLEGEIVNRRRVDNYGTGPETPVKRGGSDELRHGVLGNDMNNTAAAIAASLTSPTKVPPYKKLPPYMILLPISDPEYLFYCCPQQGTWELPECGEDYELADGRIVTVVETWNSRGFICCLIRS